MLAMSLSAKKETLIIITVATQEKEVLGRDLLTGPRGWFNLLVIYFCCAPLEAMQARSPSCVGHTVP